MWSRKMLLAVQSSAIALLLVACAADAPVVVVTATPQATRPPAGVSPGDTWTRSADGMVMVYVPGGEFQMGSDDAGVDYAVELCNEEFGDCSRGWFTDEQPAHAVSLHSFWIDRTETTNFQFRLCVEAGACQPPRESRSRTRDAYYGETAHDDYPVIYVSYDQAAAYCEWAGARLPTEAEWEYSSRGPGGQTFPWGEEPDGTRLNYCDANCALDWRDIAVDDGYADTSPSGTFPSGVSWCGAFDLAGNVWEWVADWFADYAPEPQVDPIGPSAGEYRVLRGGSWNNELVDTRGSYRSRSTPGDQSYTIGFRCARSAE